MSASYNFRVVGLAPASDNTFLKCVDHTSDLVANEVGKLSDGIIVRGDTLKEFGPNLNLEDIWCEYSTGDILGLFPEHGGSSISYCQSNLSWQFGLNIPMSEVEMSELKVETVLKSLWKSLLLEKPIFAVGGEELEIRDSDVAAISTGKSHPFEIPLCHICILSVNAEESGQTSKYTSPVANGFFQKKFELF